MSVVTFKQRLYQQYWRWISRYLQKRQPASDTVVLSQKVIFILPSRYGLWFVLLTALLYLLGTNYQNNLILLLSYLMLSLFLLCIVLTYQNMNGLTLQCSAPAELFCDNPGYINIRADNSSNHYMLRVNILGHTMIRLPALTDSLALPITPLQRGRYTLPRIKISSDFPFGLWRSWSYVGLKQEFWVYPAPLSVSQPFGAVAQQADKNQQNDNEAAIDNLAPYRSGDSLRYLLWKRLARDPSNPVIRQQQQSPQVMPDWVVVPALSGDALERALSIACQQLLELEQNGNLYGLKLPAVTISQAQGPAHLRRCLQELALC